MNKVLSLQKESISKDVQLKAQSSKRVFNVKQAVMQAGSSAKH
jgi:hypothetical protein